jgi:hypothetical protein
MHIDSASFLGHTPRALIFRVEIEFTHSARQGLNSCCTRKVAVLDFEIDIQELSKNRCHLFYEP